MEDATLENDSVLKPTTIKLSTTLVTAKPADIIGKEIPHNVVGYRDQIINDIAAGNFHPSIFTDQELEKYRRYKARYGESSGATAAEPLAHYFIQLEEERRLFWNMLVSTVARSGYAPPDNRDTVILNLACGRSHESKVLNTFFGGREYGNFSDRVRIVGVDIDEKKLLQARVICWEEASMQADALFGPHYVFVVGDATNLSAIPAVPQGADVVVIRHHEISGDLVSSKETWRKIAQQALERVQTEGTILLTSYTQYEHDAMVRTIEDLGGQVRINERNPYTFISSESKIPRDQFIAIVRRK